MIFVFIVLACVISWEVLTRFVITEPWQQYAALSVLNLGTALFEGSWFSAAIAAITLFFFYRELRRIE